MGPPGVGKSYMAQVLSEILFPGYDALLTLDMTEFGGAHSGEHARFRLIGPPPPYVGWEAGGVLTNHVLRYPVSVVLIDEFEKACDEARNVLLKIFDEGVIQDGRGRTISFRGIYFILTANAGRKLWRKVRRITLNPKEETSRRKGEELEDEELRELLLNEGFAPELLSRISYIVMFNRLEEEHLQEIARRRLMTLRDNALREDFLLIEYDENLLSRWLVQRSAAQNDCRRLTSAFERLIETPLARWRLQREGNREIKN